MFLALLIARFLFGVFQLFALMTPAFVRPVCFVYVRKVVIFRGPRIRRRTWAGDETQLYYCLHRTTHRLTFCFGFGFLCCPVLSCLPCNVSTYGNNSETRERLATRMGLL